MMRRAGMKEPGRAPKRVGEPQRRRKDGVKKGRQDFVEDEFVLSLPLVGTLRPDDGIEVWGAASEAEGMQNGELNEDGDEVAPSGGDAAADDVDDGGDHDNYDDSDGDGDSNGGVTFNPALFDARGVSREQSASPVPASPRVVLSVYSTPVEENAGADQVSVGPERIVAEPKPNHRKRAKVASKAKTKAKRRLETETKENSVYEKDEGASSESEGQVSAEGRSSKKKMSLSRQMRSIGLQVAPSKSVKRPAVEPETLPTRRDQLYGFARKMMVRQILVARERELEELSDFVTRSLEKRRGGAIYCYGASGVGKSATIAACCAKLHARHLRSSTLNLTTGSHSTNFLPEVLSRVTSRPEQLSAMQTWSSEKVVRLLRTEFETQPFILVLEEADQQAYLSAVRDLWQMATDSDLQLILLATGNHRNFAATTLQVDGTQEMPFEPYDRDDLQKILEARLTSPVVTALFEGIALRQICEKAAYEGDLRTATALVEAALRLAEEDYQSRLDDDDPRVGKINAAVVRRVFETMDSGSTKALAAAMNALTPIAKQLLVAMVKSNYGDPTHGKVERQFSMNDLRKLYCDALLVERPDVSAIKTAMGSLTDTPFVTYDEISLFYTLHIDLQVAKQAVESDVGLQCLSPG